MNSKIKAINIVVTIVTTMLACVVTLAAIILGIFTLLNAEYNGLGLEELAATIIFVYTACKLIIITYKFIACQFTKDNNTSKLLKNYIHAYKTSNWFTIAILIFSFAILKDTDILGIIIISILYSLFIYKVLKINIAEFKRCKENDNR